MCLRVRVYVRVRVVCANSTAPLTCAQRTHKHARSAAPHSITMVTLYLRLPFLDPLFNPLFTTPE